jgi:hypothetical protein
LPASLHDILWVHRASLSLQIERLRSVHEIGEHGIKTHDTRVEEWYQQQLRRITDKNVQQREYVEDLFVLQKIDVEQFYPEILRAAIFIGAYGLFEHFLVSICDEHHRLTQGVAPADLRGEGIGRARLYLIKVAQAAFPETPEWQDLDNYRLLRNALVHAQGNVETKETRLLQLQKRAGTFQIRDGQILVTREVTPTFCDTVEVFADQLIFP